MEKQNQKVGRTSQAIEWDDQKEKEKTDELRNLISEVVKFSVKICMAKSTKGTHFVWYSKRPHAAPIPPNHHPHRHPHTRGEGEERLNFF